MICPSCGTKNPDGIASCDSCGQGFEAWAPTLVGPLPKAPGSGAIPKEITGTESTVAGVPVTNVGTPDVTNFGPGVTSIGAGAGESGTTIAGRYKIKSVLGRGGVGVVYRAMDMDLGEEIAIKVLQPQSHRDPSEVERFKREIRTARAITHPNVIRIHDFGMDGKEAFISMQLLTGGTLAQLIENGPPPILESVEIAIGICEGLQAAHEQGIVHRDIKPDNVIFDSAKRPKLVDFGLARLANSTTRTVGFSGTPFYMSPEQADGAEVTARSDVYSLGVLLFEMFTGRLPFMADSLVRLAVLHTRETPPTPRSIRSDLPPAIEDIILRTLEKVPARRFQTAGEIGAAFKSWRENPVAASAAAAWSRTVTPQNPAIRTGTPVTPRPRAPSLQGARIAPQEPLPESVESTVIGMRSLPEPGRVSTGERRAVLPPAPPDAARPRIYSRVLLGFAATMTLGAGIGGFFLLGALLGGPVAKPTPTPAIIGTVKPTPTPIETPYDTTSISTPVPTAIVVATLTRNTPRPTRTPASTPTRTPVPTPTKVAIVVATPPPTPEPTVATVEPALNPGRLTVKVLPWGVVTIDGKKPPSQNKNGTRDPIERESLPPGRHVIVITTGRPTDKTRKMTIEIQPGKTMFIVVDFKDGKHPFYNSTVNGAKSEKQ